MKGLRFAALITLALIAVQAHAYIGPGLGAGTIGLILGLVGSILLAIIGIFYYPIKRMLKNKKQKQQDNSSSDAENNSAESNQNNQPANNTSDNN